jgi:hypothetical protein
MEPPCQPEITRVVRIAPQRISAERMRKKCQVLSTREEVRDEQHEPFNR